MIAVDTSALIAIIRGEPESDACIDILSSTSRVLISAGTMTEALIVAARSGLTAEMTQLFDSDQFEIVPVTAASARRSAEAYAKWGKGAHPAGLNFGDCFAYEVAKAFSCKLLFVGNDFAKTDIESAILSAV